MWILKTVFNLFRQQKNAIDLSLKYLSLKVAFLLCLLSGQRCQPITCLDLKHMDLFEDKYVFYIHEKLKQSRAGYHLKALECMTYPKEEKLCLVTHLHEYIKRTEHIHLQNTQLLIRFIKPHSPISKDTLG